MDEGQCFQDTNVGGECSSRRGSLTAAVTKRLEKEKSLTDDLEQIQRLYDSIDPNANLRFIYSATKQRHESLEKILDRIKSEPIGFEKELAALEMGKLLFGETIEGSEKLSKLIGAVGDFSQSKDQKSFCEELCEILALEPPKEMDFNVSVGYAHNFRGPFEKTPDAELGAPADGAVPPQSSTTYRLPTRVWPGSLSDLTREFNLSTKFAGSYHDSLLLAIFMLDWAKNHKKNRKEIFKIERKRLADDKARYRQMEDGVRRRELRSVIETNTRNLGIEDDITVIASEHVSRLQARVRTMGHLSDAREIAKQCFGEDEIGSNKFKRIVQLIYMLTKHKNVGEFLTNLCGELGFVIWKGSQETGEIAASDIDGPSVKKTKHNEN